MAAGPWDSLYRETLLRRLTSPAASGVASVGRWLPLVDAPAPAAVEARIRGFVDALEHLTADPPRLAAALLLGFLGHLAVATTLWLAVWALGARVPPHDALLVVPLAKSSGLSPTWRGTNAGW